MRSIPRLAIFMLVLVMLLIPAAAWAMAGGGGRYSSGGGKGDGAAGLIELVFFLLRICIEHPTLGLPLVVTLVVLIAVACLFSKDKGTEAYRGHIIRKGNAILMDAQKKEALARLKAKDPDFSELEFLNRVREAFTKIQLAWCNQDMRQAQAFVSDGILERFSLQFNEQRELGYRDRMDELTVDMPELAQACSDENFDIVAVRVMSRARDYQVKLKDGNPLSDVPQLNDYCEYWSLMRHSGAKTTPGKPGLMEGQCPNCGAKIELNQSASCPQCSALLRSGQYDWMLAEITQECEWRGSDPSIPPGFAALQALDPEFNLLHIEDRVSVMFWRRVECGRTGKIDPLRKMATPECCERMAALLSKNNDVGQRSWWGECAVGSVETLGLRVSSEQHQALLEVRWAGTRFHCQTGQPPVRGADKILSRSLYLISRNAGVISEAAKSLTSAHCPGCGAPEPLTTANACAYCGVVQNDGSRDWVLERIEPALSVEGLILMREFTRVANDQPQRATSLAGAPLKGGSVGQLAWVIKMCAVDGVITDSERVWIDKVAARWKLPQDEVEQMIGAALKGSLEVHAPQGRDEARAWLEDMARSALADGSISSAEEKLLIATGQRFDYSPTDVRLMIASIKKELYQAAKVQIRQTRIMKKPD